MLYMTNEIRETNVSDKKQKNAFCTYEVFKKKNRFVEISCEIEDFVELNEYEEACKMQKVLMYTNRHKIKRSSARDHYCY